MKIIFLLVTILASTSFSANDLGYSRGYFKGCGPWVKYEVEKLQNMIAFRDGYIEGLEEHIQSYQKVDHKKSAMVVTRPILRRQQSKNSFSP